MKDEVPKKKTLSVNFTCALFSLLFTHDDLVMQVCVWLHMVWFRAIGFGHSSLVLHMQSYDHLTYLSITFKEQNLVLHSSEYSIFNYP
jgi:hypothetical protein